MNSPTQQQSPSPREQRFELAVWPMTQAEPWHAEVCAQGESMTRRFERPVDLVLYLTQLSHPTPQQRGLR